MSFSSALEQHHHHHHHCSPCLDFLQNVHRGLSFLFSSSRLAPFPSERLTLLFFQHLPACPPGNAKAANKPIYDVLRVIVCFDMQALEDVTQVLNDCGISSITRKRGVCSYFVLTLIDSLISAVSKGHGGDALARITAITKAAALRPHATPAESPSSGGGSGSGKGCASNSLEAAWSADEDAILLDQVAKESLRFSLIATLFLRGKTTKQCKDRCVGLSALLNSPSLFDLHSTSQPSLPFSLSSPLSAFYLYCWRPAGSNCWPRQGQQRPRPWHVPLWVSKLPNFAFVCLCKKFPNPIPSSLKKTFSVRPTPPSALKKQAATAAPAEHVASSSSSSSSAAPVSCALPTKNRSRRATTPPKINFVSALAASPSSSCGGGGSGVGSDACAAGSCGAIGPGGSGLGGTPAAASAARAATVATAAAAPFVGDTDGVEAAAAKGFVSRTRPRKAAPQLTPPPPPPARPSPPARGRSARPGLRRGPWTRPSARRWRGS